MGHGELSDMRHYHFLNSTRDIGGPPSRAPVQHAWESRSRFRMGQTTFTIKSTANIYQVPRDVPLVSDLFCFSKEYVRILPTFLVRTWCDFTKKALNFT